MPTEKKKKKLLVLGNAQIRLTTVPLSLLFGSRKDERKREDFVKTFTKPRQVSRTKCLGLVVLVFGISK